MIHTEVSPMRPHHRDPTPTSYDPDEWTGPECGDFRPYPTRPALLDPTPMSWRRLTQLILLALPLLVGGYDLAAFLRSGNDATVSMVILDAAKEWPIVSLLFGVLVGHLFVPQHVPRE